MQFKPNALQKNRFVKTIEENIDIFDELIKTIKSINNKIKIYIILIQQHKVVEDFEKNIEENCKKEFDKILEPFKQKYELKILDFKNNTKISSCSDYYYDMKHLNYVGASIFTELLNSYIEL